MWIFGLCVLLETPRERRKRRAIYLAVSFVILVLDCFFKFPMANFSFELLYRPNRAKEVDDLREELFETWYVKRSDWASAMIMWIGSGLLVSSLYLIGKK